VIDASATRLPVNFHTAYNIAASLIFLPLVDVVAWACRRLLPAKPVVDDPGKPRHLDPNVLDSPAEALGCALRETLNLGEPRRRHAARNHRRLRAQRSQGGEGNRSRRRRGRSALRGDQALPYPDLAYRARRGRRQALHRDPDLTTNLEHIGDIVDKNLMELATKKIRNRYAFSPEGMAELRAFHGLVLDNCGWAERLHHTRHPRWRAGWSPRRPPCARRRPRQADSHYARLREGRMESIETSSIHMDVIRDLKRQSTPPRLGAYPILEAAGELADTRLKTTQPLMRAPAGS